MQEYGNGYYSCFSYFMSKVLSDIPFQLILPNLGSIPVYYMTGQYSEQIWRVFGFALIFILVSFNGSAQGFLISVLLAENPLACAFIAILTIIPMSLLSGNEKVIERKALIQSYCRCDDQTGDNALLFPVHDLHQFLPIYMRSIYN